MIDKACLLWQELCGQRGFCFVYQNAAMSRYLLSAGLAYKVSWGGGGLGSPPPAGGPAAAPGARGCSRCAERRPRTFTAIVGAVVTRWQ